MRSDVAVGTWRTRLIRATMAGGIGLAMVGGVTAFAGPAQADDDPGAADAVYTMTNSPPHLPTESAAWWFLIQVGMLIGFITTYPVNWWLIRHGIKELM